MKSCKTIALRLLLCASVSFPAGFAGAAASGTASLAEPPGTGGPPMLRRLTEAQYRATIADVFGPDIPVTARFERALRSEGLVAVGTSEAGLSAFALEQYDTAAGAIAAAVLAPERRERFVPCDSPPVQHFDPDCAAAFIERHGTRLFRRALEAEEATAWLDVARAAHTRLGDFYAALEFTLVGMLVAPDFLLRVEAVATTPAADGSPRLDAYSRATRLSYFLTGSAPDAGLLAAAGRGALDSPDGLAREVDRLMAGPRYEAAVREFFTDMLRFDLFDDLAKDPVIYPAFNSTVAADAQEQTLRTITGHLLAGEGDYRDLFTTRAAPLTRSLGIVYRQPVAVRNGWQEGEFSERSGRVGIQSHLSFLALHSHPGRSSPTLRGKAIREVFLCQHMPDPPVDVDFTGINDDTNAARPTARDRLQAHATETQCKACHVLMDPAGLALEYYDGLGAFRTRENGAEIDVSGALDAKSFAAASGLGTALAEHSQTTSCLVRRMYSFATGRRELPGERAYLEYLDATFAAAGYRVPALMRAIALSDAFYRIAPETNDEVATGHDVPAAGES